MIQINRQVVLWIINFLLIGTILVLHFFVKKTQPKTGFIYNQQVFSGFNGTKDMEQKLEVIFSADRKTLDSLGALIEAGNYDLKASYQSRLEAYTTRHAELSEQYTAELWKRINEAVSNYGKKNNYEFIFGAAGTGNLMYASKTSDITADVVKYINKEYEGE